jgi:hypothetical protein
MFNRVYRLEIQSVMFAFSIPPVNYRPCDLLNGSPPTLPLPCVKNKNSRGVYFYGVFCVTRGDRGLRQINTCRQVPTLTGKVKEKPTFRVWCLFERWKYLSLGNLCFNIK